MRRLLSAEEINQLLRYLDERFGIERTHFSSYIFERTKRDIFIRPEMKELKLTLEKPGLRAFNGEKHPAKPTSSFIQRFGHLASKGCVDLDPDSLSIFIDGKTCFGVAQELSNGYCIVRRRGISIGCGFVRDGNLESQFPLKVGRSIARKFL